MHATPRNPSTIVGRITRYAIVLETPAGVSTLAYFARVNRFDLLRLAQRHAGMILPHIATEDTVTYRAGELRLGKCVRLYRSNETERDAWAKT